MSNMIRRGANDFSFSDVRNCNVEVAKKEYYIWVYWNCCPNYEQRCHCEKCIVYKFFISMYLYGI